MFDFSLTQSSIVHLSIFSLTLCVLLALCLDKIIGEAERFHPLVGFGNIAKRIEAHFNKGAKLKLKGALALILCIVPLSVLGYLLSTLLRDDLFAEIIFSSFILYITIGWRSLLEHGKAVYEALEKHDLSLAREAVSRIVSRDCDELNETEIAVAATESILENGADAIFAAIFWFLVAGVPGVICYRLANTLDAMWAYKNKRFLKFGWAAARFDDALNYFPARLTAISYALMGHTRNALSCWFRHGSRCRRPPSQLRWQGYISRNHSPSPATWLEAITAYTRQCEKHQRGVQASQQSCFTLDLSTCFIHRICRTSEQLKFH
jgi:adenosylcobinamide-phosphate synthase